MALNDIVSELQADLDGDTMSRQTVVDGLLDLRLEAMSSPALVEMIDRILADVPGKTMVLTEWWSEQLDLFLLEIDREASPA
ncbi:MAG: hypothetical protein AAGA99_09775 [Actinomycetota bacterium]